MIGATFSLLLYIVFPIAAIILIIWHDSVTRKKKAELAKQNPDTAGKVASKNLPQQQIQQKPKNPYTVFNVLLFIGSGFIITAILTFLQNTDESFVPPAIFSITAFLYILGLALYKKVSYLKPVGIAFALSSLFIIPFWSSCFSYYGLKPVYSAMISFWLTFIATTASCFVFDIKFLKYRAYYWLYFAICSLTFASDKFGTFATTAVIAGTLLSIPPIVLYGKKVSWLPVKYRSVTKNYAIIVPIVTTIIGLMFSVNAPEDGMLIYRSILFTCLTFLAALAYCLFSKKYLYFSLLRLSIQALIVSVVLDIVSYRFIDLFEYNQPNSILIASVAIFISSLIQGALSVIARPQTENQHICEFFMAILAMFGMAISTASFDTLMSDTANVCYIIVEIAIAALGICLCIRRRNVLWCIASLLALVCIPTHLGSLISSDEIASLIISICYAVLAIVLSLLYITLRKIDDKKAAVVTITAFTIFSLFSLAHAIYYDHEWASCIPFFGFALASVVYGLISKNKVILEIGAYSGAIALCPLLSTAQSDSIIKTQSYSNYRYNVTFTYGYYLADFAQVVLISGTLFGMSLWREIFRKPETKLRVRLCFAFYIFALIGVGIAGEAESNGYLSLIIVYMLIQATILAISAVKHKIWLVVSSAIALGIGLLCVIGDAPYLWIGIIGVGLITFVIYELSRTAKKNEIAAGNSNKIEGTKKK